MTSPLETLLTLINSTEERDRLAEERGYWNGVVWAPGKMFFDTGYDAASSHARVLGEIAKVLAHENKMLKFKILHHVQFAEGLALSVAAEHLKKMEGK